MTKSKKQSSLTCNLLDLPDAVLNIIISSLEGSDRTGFMAACSRVFHMAMLTAKTRLKITQTARLAGIKKVLNTSPAQIHLEIICPSADKDVNAVYHTPLSALAVLMGLLPETYSSQLAASCHWERITKVTIQATMMQCLVPHFLATACPYLKHLKIMRPSSTECHNNELFITEQGAGLPLSICSSLMQLEIEDYTERPLELPAHFHNPTQLRGNLPNIDTLILAIPNNDLIQAFATQLTSLEVGTPRVAQLDEEVQQSIRQCFNLQHLRVPKLFLPDNTAALEVLELNISPRDEGFGKLLQLPSLTKLQLLKLDRIQQDWSGHECSWQELCIKQYLEFTVLGKINLSSLRKLSIGSDAVVGLPDPSNADSLAAVQRAADSLAHVGQIMVNSRTSKATVCFGECGAMQWFVHGHNQDHEQQAAELISVAAQRIGPCRVCDCNWTCRPQELDAIVSWGQTSIESVCLGEYYSDNTNTASVWQALQRLQKLSTVVFWICEEASRLDLRAEAAAQDLLTMSGIVSSAARHYVMPTNRSLRLEFGVNSWNVDEAIVTDGKVFLEASMQEVLPAGSKLASIEFFYMKGNALYTKYGNSTDADAVWVFVVEPTGA